MARSSGGPLDDLEMSPGILLPPHFVFALELSVAKLI
jgi:hypothetical protein